MAARQQHQRITHPRRERTVDLIVVLAVLAGFIAFPIAALTHGADTRDGFNRRTR